MRKTVYIILACVLVLTGCRHRNVNGTVPQEDLQAKKMLQGIWVDEDDEEDVAFRAKGDTIYYPDSTSQPAYFKIIKDTFYLEGSETVKYPIVRQSPHVFQFKNQNGDLVKLIKSEDPSDIDNFQQKRVVALNQNKLVKRDTVLMYHNQRYHSYIQVNPTTYKVIKPTYNDDGVEVDNVYYDNIVYVSLYQGAMKVFSRDFHKQDFKRQIPGPFLRQGILSDIVFQKIDQEGVTYTAVIASPDSDSSYEVNIIISFRGQMRLEIQ
ncbi:MAG: DUF4738 domain-containing protein [Prevotella sp.]|jgi:hypothetical protein|nr:DUF4738 domain-containing protein [Prevotella sp.]MCH4017548.1 DUF4738 domain-containing protein [Prevotella sp.]MCI1323951.1 DUF4738 domain-containing protein [Prevotella sp.]MCI1415027.1 DUF4738 domain-containing protein [Prevotella sp.]